MSPEAWVAVARLIVQHNPSEAGLRIAIGVLYYAMFHAAAEDATDLFVGEVESSLGRYVWRHVYRGPDHGRLRAACNHEIMKQFSLPIREFSQILVEMQRERLRADYDPYASFEESRVLSHIDRVKDAIRDFTAASAEERKMFAALILFKIRTP